MRSSTGVPVPENVPVLDIDPYSDEALLDPLPLHETVRCAGSVSFMPKYGVYVMGRYRDIVPMLRDWERFSSTSGSGIADIRQPEAWRAPSPIVEVDPPRHTQVRTVVQRILSPALIKEWRERFRASAETLIDEMVRRKRIDAVNDLALTFVADFVAKAIGWAPHPQLRERLMLLGALNFDGQGPRNDRFLATEAAAVPIMDWNNALMQRDALSSDGFGEQIYRAADRGEIEPEIAPLLVRSFIRGGLDTSVSTLSAVFYHLATAPEEYARLRHDPSLIRRALDEAMRLETPIQTVCRLTMADVTFDDGIVVPKNNKIIVLLASANRDPDTWTEPDRFMLNRPVQAHLGLGTGVHMCVGQMIARLEGELLLKALIERVSSISVAEAPTRKLNNNLRSFDVVPLELAGV
jgi:cytochrome P450